MQKFKFKNQLANRFPAFGIAIVLFSSIYLAVAEPVSSAGGLTRANSRKPAKTVLQPGHEQNRIAVKFRDGLNVRLRNGALVSTNAQLFSGAASLFQTLSAVKWERAEAVSEETLDDMRHRAEKRLGRALPDMNLQFYLTLPPGMEAGAAIDQLNKLDIVDLAQPVPRPAPAPLPPDFQPMQTYCQTAPTGGSVFNTWTNFGVFGAGVRVADVEYSFNSNHMDLPTIDNLTPDAVDPFNDNNHGTATLGEISALENGWGTTGVGYGASFYFAGADYPSGYNVGSGITTAASQLRAGDILLIEQSVWGPNSTQGVMDTGGEFGTVPVDWYEPYYNDIVMAVGLGIIVIETADNGGQNLDDPLYSTGNGGNWPFLPQNRSGAIIVGAGASLNGSSTERSPLYFANYGSCVDVQNWGENIVTTGYGDLYDSEGADLFYTSTFGGTSGATPIVVGEAALLQSIYKNATGQTLASEQIRTLLRNTGLPETSGAYPIFANIGPLPNTLLAVQTALAITGPPAVVACTTNATALVGGTATLGVAATGAPPLRYQWHFNGTNLTDGPNVFGSTNAELILLNLTASQTGAYSVTVTNNSGAANASGLLSLVSDPSTAPGVTLSNLYTFTAAYDGAGPLGLTPDGLGNLYGVTQYGGTNGDGGIFEFTPASQSFTVLYSFTNGVDGAYPFTPMALGDDGNFYGTTEGDQQTTFGTIFQMGPDGTFVPLYSFTGGSDGGSPQGTLVEGPGSLLYGTAYGGGSENQGVIFTIDFYGNYNVIHNFDFYNGAGPYGGLVLASDGNFYGTTTWGGANNQGVIYRISPSGTFSNLFSFNGTNGVNPSDDLVQGLDGRLYGTTYGGGAHGDGTVFGITTNGAFESLFSFAGTNGANPHGALIAGNDGNVYGATTGGGTNGQDGVIFEVSPGGAGSVEAYFDGLNGASAFASMVRNVDGNFYGTTFQGGYDAGVIYQLSFASTARPVIESVTRAGSQIKIISSVIPGRTYQLQSATNLYPPVWTSVGPATTATSTAFSVSDTLTDGSHKFYRVKLDSP